jgi:hypothetical protein
METKSCKKLQQKNNSKMVTIYDNNSIKIKNILRR